MFKINNILFMYVCYEGYAIIYTATLLYGKDGHLLTHLLAPNKKEQAKVQNSKKQVIGL